MNLDFTKKQLEQFGKKRIAIYEILHCFGLQTGNLPDDIIRLAEFASSVRLGDERLEPFIEIARGMFNINFHNVMKAHNITFNNYYVEPEVNHIW